MEIDPDTKPNAGEGRRCPVCSAPLVSKKVKAAMVDVCDAHGIWLDHGELDGILARRVRSMSLKTKAAIRDARKGDKVTGILLGWWSLFSD
jgi:Zn-finger nucleic acid-binding protein